MKITAKQILDAIQEHELIGSNGYAQTGPGYDLGDVTLDLTVNLTAVAKALNDRAWKPHCWFRGLKHSWTWKTGKHRLMDYRYCTECGWPGGHRPGPAWNEPGKP